MRSVGAFLVMCIAQSIFAQNPPSDANPADANKSWSASSEQQSFSAGSNPSRTTESHSRHDGRTVDKQTIELRGLDGSYEPYREIEKESIRVDAGTTRVIERTFGRGPDGQKTLVQVREEETRTLTGGDQKVVRTTSNPDPNGRLQVVQRELQETRQSSPGVQNTKNTVYIPDVNGALSPALQTEEHRTQKNNGSVEFSKSTALPDGNGGWQVQEVREGRISEEHDKSRSKEERVLRPGSDGKLSLVERTVTTEAESAPGEKRRTIDNYSVDLPGATSDGTLQLNQRVTTVQRVAADGAQSTVEQVEQRNPADPSQPPRLTQKTIDIVRPGMGNTSSETRTIQSLDPNGNLGKVWVDTSKIETSPAVQVDTKQPNNSSTVNVDTKASPKQ